MKNWIKTQLRESLNEMKPTPKPEFGSGAWHKVYLSRQHPDRLYKIGREDSVDEWLKTFQQNPKYFPKVYRVFPYSKNPKYKVVEIERLTLGKARRELNEIDSFLLDISDSVDCGGEFITNLNFFQGLCFQKVVNAAQATNNPEIIPMLYKWGKFISAVSNIVEKDLGRDVDLHIGNVGYDKDGNLKMIDI